MEAILLQVILIGLNAVFASAEIAVISMNDTKLERMARDGDARAKRLAALTAQPTKFLSTIQVAITLAGLLGSAFAAENFAGTLVQVIQKAGIDAPAIFVAFIYYSIMNMNIQERDARFPL